MQNSTTTKKSPSTSHHAVTHADDDPDAPVLIDPCYLVEHHGMSKKVAIRVAKGAFEICSKRWRQAEVRVSDDEINEASSFIHIGYASKISRHDIDMEGWASHGAALKAEIHDYLLIRACEEVGIRPPTFARARALDPMQELSARWNGAKVTDEFHRLASSAAWHAALFTGLRNFDRITMSMSISKARRSKFKKSLSASLKKFIVCIPKMEAQGKSLISNLGIETGSAIVSESDDMVEIAIRAYATVTFSDAVESFARTYVLTLGGV